MESATRSLTEPPGLNCSHLQNTAAMSGVIRFRRRTSGVPPISSSMLLTATAGIECESYPMRVRAGSLVGRASAQGAYPVDSDHADAGAVRAKASVGIERIPIGSDGWAGDRGGRGCRCIAGTLGGVQNREHACGGIDFGVAGRDASTSATTSIATDDPDAGSIGTESSFGVEIGLIVHHARSVPERLRALATAAEWISAPVRDYQ